jgi:Flp pilus assembly protein TadG
MLVRSASDLGRRRGATAVETAVVIPVVLTISLGMVIVGLGIFHYQQVATMAREGARYASVHGSQYATDTGKLAAAASDVYNNAIEPMAAGLNSNNLSYQVQWGTAVNWDTAVSGRWVWTPWDSSSKVPTSANPNSSPAGQPMYNGVQVTVTYTWTPGLYITGSINLTSTCVMPMSY